MSALEKLAIALLLAIGVAAGAARVGWVMNDRNWQAKENERLQDEREHQAAELRRGEKASGAFQAELQQAQTDRDQLERAFNAYKRQYPILARRPVVQPATVAASGPAGQVQCPALPGGEPAALSLGAVWMWNSALLGRDAPAGACGLADASEGACAADAGVSLEDAWDNQALNAKLCAEDRLRHQRLIDYIKGRAKQ